MATSDWEAAQLPDDLSFEDWVKYIFDHPVLDPRWWWHDPGSPEFSFWDEEGNPARTVEYMTRMFRHPGEAAQRYSRAQIDQGLNFLVSNSCSNHMFALTNEAVPWEDRRDCLESLVTLYSDLMAPVYGNDLAAGMSAPADPDRPNYACYMWWDIIPIGPFNQTPEEDRIGRVILRVFEQVLQLKSEACLESVLHGLGHWHRAYPQEVQSIVNSFLAVRKDLSMDIKGYAAAAATGAVL